MTGLEALAEAARLELARVYATTSPEHRTVTLPAITPRDQHRYDELAARRHRKATGNIPADIPAAVGGEP